MRILTLLLICSLQLTRLTAQQLPQYSLWLLNPYAYNPAYAGLDNSLVITGLYRQQWVDLDGAPVTQHINAHLPVAIIRSGVGLRLDNDRIGAHQTTQAMLNYDYQIEIGRNTLVSIGVGAGFQQYSLDGDRLRAPDGSYSQGVLNHNDPYLPLGRISAGAPVFELGAFVQTSNLNIGVAMQPVFAPNIETNASGQFRLKPSRHYLLMASWQRPIGEIFVLQPGVMIKSDLVKTQAEVSSLLHWKEKYFVGGAWRGLGASNKDAIILIAGMKLSEKVTFGYSFDLPVSGIKAVTRGSHELLLRYNLNRPIGAGKLPPVIYNPRFL